MTPPFIVADLDYLTLVGSGEVRSLFVPDSEKQWEALRDKKSTDASAMIAALKEAIDKTDVIKLNNFLVYLMSRHRRLKDSLSEHEQATVRTELERLWSQDVLILKGGEIEDYLPPGVSGVKEIVDLTTDRNWINGIPNESHRVELGKLICQILDISAKESTQLQEELRQQRVVFPRALSDSGAPRRGSDE
jgi:putative ATP-dependent endonuclease of the OLD family